MTRKLEQLLNLAPAPDSVQELTAETAQEFIEQNQNIINEVDAAIDKIDLALPLVRDLDTGDQELDELATLAKDRAQDMIDLGMNSDPRFAGVILQTASNMLGHAITAKTAKMDKKLRMIQLQMQKARLDHQIKKDNINSSVDAPVEGHGIILDRNELLKQILDKKDK